MAKRVVHRLSPMPAAEALRVLARALVDSPEGFERSLRVQTDGDGRAIIEVTTQHTRPDRPLDPEREGRIYAASNLDRQARGLGARDPADIRWKIEIVEEAPNPDLFAQLAALLAQAIGDAGSGIGAGVALAEPAENVLFALGPGTAEIDALARELTAIEWRSTGTVIAGHAGTSAVVASFGVDPRYGATQHIAAQQTWLYNARVQLFLAYPFDAGQLLLDPAMLLDDELLQASGRLFRLLRRRSDPEAAPIALFIGAAQPAEAAIDARQAVQVVLAELPVQPVSSPAQSVSRDGVVAPLSIDYVVLEQSADATERLRAAMERAAEDIGYRLELHPVPSYGGYRSELEEVQRQIEDLETRRSLLLGETEQDWRLLRFPAEGLQAMIDFLRRFPLEVADQGHIKYAFHASTSATGGVHYLLYQTRHIGTEPPYPDQHWSGLTRSGTIVYRLDPLFAQFVASHAANSLVFTPEQYVVSPSFRSTQQDVDDYLQAGFAGLLGESEVFRDLVPGQTAAGIYLLGFSASGEVRLEIMEQSRFQPIGRVVPFINSNLELSPRIDTEQFIERAADASWRRDMLEHLSGQVAALKAASDRDVEALDHDLAAQVDGIFTGLTAEVDAVRSRIEKLLSLIEELSDRAGHIDGIVTAAIDKAAGVEQQADALPPYFSELTQTRERIQNTAAHQAEASRAFVTMTGARLSALRADIERLEQELR